MATLTAAGGAKVAVFDADARNSRRTDNAPLPLPMRLHRTFRSRVERETATSLPDAARVRDGGNLWALLGLSEERDAHGKREFLATLAGCFADRHGGDQH